MQRTATFLLGLSLAASSTASADGMLDPSFGNGGIVITSFPLVPPSYDAAVSLVVLPDGRAVAAGGAGDLIAPAMAAARYLSSGALDTTFGGDGLVTVACQPPSFPGGGAVAALLQPDGRLILVGSCPNPAGQILWLGRFNVDGSLDPSFGTGGQVYTPFPGGVSAAAGLLQPDGRIVAVGGSGLAVKAARYNPDGSLDPTFGTAGQVSLPFAENFQVASAALQPDGKLVIGGRYGPPSGAAQDFGVLRLLPSGAPDPSFDGDGLVRSDFGAPETGTSVIVLGDGRLVLAGVATVLEDFALVRYLPDGTLDTSFGVGGLATANAGGEDVVQQVVELPNGKLFLAGHTDAGGGRDFLLARFHSNGALDISFGTAGFLQTDLGSSLEFCRSVAIAGPDLILTAGFTFLGPDFDFALARYIATTPVELLRFEVE